MILLVFSEAVSDITEGFCVKLGLLADLICKEFPADLTESIIVLFPC